MGLRVTGLEVTARRLENFGKLSNSTTRDAMRQGVEDFVKLASALAPRKTGTLERAFVVKTDRGGLSGRKRFTVTLRENARTPDGKRLGSYAPYVETNTGRGAGRYGRTELGRAKNVENAGNPLVGGKRVGPHFIYRAGMTIEPIIRKRLREALKRARQRSGLKGR